MKKNAIKVLLVDDDEDDYVLISDYLKEISHQEFSIEWTASYNDALEKINTKHYDVYIVDYLLGGYTGMELLKKVAGDNGAAPFIMLTGMGDYSTDLRAMEYGAADYLVKGELDSTNLERSIRHAIERSKAFKIIRESEQKYRNVFERSRDMLYITDGEGNFIDVNDSGSRIFGYAKEELLNLNISKLFENDDQLKLFEEAIRLTGEVNDFETSLKTKWGEKRVCLVTSSLQTTEESKKTYEGIIHDITKRRKAEQDLVTMEKLAVTGRVVRMLAHEVRNPLTNINLAIEQLKLNSSSEADIESYYEIIKRNADRINNIITELLNSSKPAKLSIAKHSVNSLIDETLELAKDRIALNNIKVIKNYSSDICDISIDAEKVKLALLNIIVNAIEAMEPDKGILTITTKGEEGKCIIIIEDNGAGIPKENISKIFDPFFSGKSTGTGLGLSTTHNIVIMHKGTIDVESEPGKGTRFKLAFNFD
jgi:PAS domain S-box-containing protein